MFELRFLLIPWKKLAWIKASFFILLLTSYLYPAEAQNKKKLSPLQKISVKLSITGDIKGEYNFDGGLGEKLTAQNMTVSESTGSPCVARAEFAEVLRLEKRNLQTWIDFKCTISGQEVELKAHRFFVDLKSIATNQTEKVTLKYFTHQIKNIEITISDLKISGSQSK